jgi:predicted PurR-regulated permease PerM
MRGSAFALIPRAYHMRVSRILLNLELIVGGYVRGQIITSALMMGFTFVVLTVADVPNALALALFAGLVDVLPYIGALLACIPAFIATLPHGMPTALTVLGVLAVYQELESRYIAPRVYGHALRLPAATMLVALLIGGKLLGVLGALLALPVAAGVRMIFAELHFAYPGDDRHDTDEAALEAASDRDFEARTIGVSATAAAAIATEIAGRGREEHVDERAAPPGAPR